MIGTCYFGNTTVGGTFVATAAATCSTALNVVGALTAGSLSVFGSKSFDMPSTYKPGWRIRHR